MAQQPIKIDRSFGRLRNQRLKADRNNPRTPCGNWTGPSLSSKSLPINWMLSNAIETLARANDCIAG
jgi:hypothetical protein